MITKQRLDGLLFAILGDETLVDRWWNSPNQAFANSKPLELFESAPEQVRDYIFAYCGLVTPCS